MAIQRPPNGRPRHSPAVSGCSRAALEPMAAALASATPSLGKGSRVHRGTRPRCLARGPASVPRIRERSRAAWPPRARGLPVPGRSTRIQLRRARNGRRTRSKRRDGLCQRDRVMLCDKRDAGPDLEAGLRRDDRQRDIRDRTFASSAQASHRRQGRATGWSGGCGCAPAARPRRSRALRPRGRSGHGQGPVRREVVHADQGTGLHSAHGTSGCQPHDPHSRFVCTDRSE